MKINIRKLFIVVTLTILVQGFCFADSAVTTSKVTVKVGGTSKQITVVWTDLNDPLIKIDVVPAKGGVGQVDSLKDIVDSSTNSSYTALAGANGTFFNAYSVGVDSQPQGTIISNGDIKHISNAGSVFTFDTDNKGRILTTNIVIKGGTQDQWEWPYNWYAWNINHFYIDEKAVMVFNADYKGYKPAHQFTGVKVENGKVTKIQKGLWEIPANGFLVLTNDQKVLDVFSIGVKAAYDYNYQTKANGDVNAYFKNVTAAVGAGPTLISGGVVVVDPVAEGFTESKITTDAGTRTLLGTTSSKKMGMAVVSGVTVFQLADIAKQLGMVEAINLDGGGSSGLYANGSYIAVPGREISNALVVKKLKSAPINVVLNGFKLLFDSEPYIDRASGRTMVPLRGIAEALGAEIGWDASSQMITVNKQGTMIKLQNNSKTAIIDGVANSIDTPVAIRDGRSFVPVRFITTVFGGDVTWNEPTRSVHLKIVNTNDLLESAKNKMSTGLYSDAIKAYEEVLVFDTTNLFVLKQLAYAYRYHMKDESKASDYYKKIMDLDSSDKDMASTYGWMLYSSNDMNGAIKVFTAITALGDEDSATAGAYYALGNCYSSYSIKDVDTAKEYYQKSLDLGLKGEPANYAQNYLNNN